MKVGIIKYSDELLLLDKTFIKFGSIINWTDD